MSQLWRDLDTLLVPRAASRVQRTFTVMRRRRLAALTVLLATAGLLAGIVIGISDNLGSGAGTGGLVTTYQLGPSPGEPISAYATASLARLARFAAGSPDTRAYAVVDLSRYETSAQLAATLRGVVLELVWARVHVPGRATHEYPLPASAAAAIGPQLAAVAVRARVAAANYQHLLVEGPPARARAGVRLQLAAFTAEAHRFNAGCACLYAALVAGTGRALQSLAGTPGVRIVDIAPPTVSFQGLGNPLPVLPEITGAFPTGGVTAEVVPVL